MLLKNYLKMNEILIFKIGGKLIDDEFLLNDFLKKFSMIKSPKILVHGGGLGIKKKLDEQNIKSKFIMGLRVTDEKMINIVVYLDLMKIIDGLIYLSFTNF